MGAGLARLVRTMRAFLVSIFGGLMSWWGLGLIGFLDTSIVFFLPLAVDISLIILVSRSRDLFWIYPVIATIGSVVGGALTFYIGRVIGEAGLEHFVAKKQLAMFRHRIEGRGAVALAVLSLIPPPFPFTACILAAGALRVNTCAFFTTLALSRLLQYGAESVLAYFYGRRIIRWLRSDILEYIGTILLAVVVIGSVITTIQLMRKTRAHLRAAKESRAA
jgi:membrane protein YqaA with SNARE-associated domain